jgi:PAS domain S-box-containing protein
MSTGGLAQTAHTAVGAPFSSRHAPARPGRHAPSPQAPPGAVPRTDDAALARAAREAAEMVGDACVVWLVVDDGRRLEPVAAHHRDRRLRPALDSFLDQETIEPDSHWPGQVAWHGAPVRLRKARPSDLGIGVGVGMRRSHALLAPVLDGGRTTAVIAVLREPHEPPYSLREEIVLRRIGVKTAARLGVRFAHWRQAAGVGAGGGAAPGRADGDAGGDGDGPDVGNKPPLDGPGWSPPPSWLMDHVGVGVWLTDREGVTTYVNSAMTEMLGMPSPKVVGRPMKDFLEDPPQMLRGEYCMDAECCDRRLTQPDGRHLWLEMTSAPLVDDEGRRRGTVSTAVDVTERKKVELAARQRVPRAHRRA